MSYRSESTSAGGNIDLNKIILVAIVFASISGVGFLSHNVFSIDLQSFQFLGSIDEFTSPVCTCAGDDGLFSMENCQQFMGDYSDPNMLCVWEAGIEEYGDPPSSAQGCGVGFWKNNAGSSELSVIESESDTMWPPGYQPDYYYNDMFHTTILALPENVIDDDKKKDSKENEIHRNDVISEDETDENDDKKKDSKENEIHRNDVILEDEELGDSEDDPASEDDVNKKKDSKENEIHRNDVILEDEELGEEENETSEDWDEKRKEKRELTKPSGGGKVVICHDNDTIEVNSARLQEHIDHGDTMEACPEEEDSELTLLEALNAKGGTMNALLRQSVAALLNAAHSDVNYPNSVIEVISLTQIALISEDYDETANMFEEFNDDLEKPLLCADG